MIDNYINQYGRRLYGLCIALCANFMEADDLYQETWLRVVEHISKYDTSRGFEPWLTRVCVNTYRNKLRRLARNPVYERFSSSEEKDAIINSVLAPTKEDFSVLHGAINRLPEKLRTTIVLFYFRDMDISSVAQVLNIPAGTVKSRLSRSKKLLKGTLKYESDLPF